MNKAKKIAIVANWDWVLYNFRLPLARALLNRGLDLTLISPPGKYSEKILAQGFRWLPWKLDRRSLLPFSELRSIAELARIYRAEQFDAVHHFTIKPILFGSIAARRADVPIIINNFSGLGYLFSASPLARILRWGLSPIMRWALRAKNTHLVFQNEEDLKKISSYISADPADQTLIKGTGVDLEKLQAKRGSKKRKTNVSVLLAARLLYDKGVIEFGEAAKSLARSQPSAEFWIAGGRDDGNPSSIAIADIDEMKKNSNLHFLGHRADVIELLDRADIAVLPSYHEGVPLFLLEAAAKGLPIVATDIEGCRLIVKEGQNGFLVPVGDASSLAQAIEKLLKDADLRIKMGAQSRKIVEQNFDLKSILSQYEKLYLKLGLLEK